MHSTKGDNTTTHISTSAQGEAASALIFWIDSHLYQYFMDKMTSTASTASTDNDIGLALKAYKLCWESRHGHFRRLHNIRKGIR
jgi:hypothetical protein